MDELLDIDLAWGGFYAGISKDNGEISVFRLLDFNQNAYHIAIYKENFQHIPSEKEILSLSPYIGHAPIDSKGLLNYEKNNPHQYQAAHKRRLGRLHALP